jgi:hypothetical protein
MVVSIVDHQMFLWAMIVEVAVLIDQTRAASRKPTTRSAHCPGHAPEQHLPGSRPETARDGLCWSGTISDLLQDNAIRPTFDWKFGRLTLTQVRILHLPPRSAGSHTYQSVGLAGAARDRRIARQKGHQGLRPGRRLAYLEPVGLHLLRFLTCTCQLTPQVSASEALEGHRSLVDNDRESAGNVRLRREQRTSQVLGAQAHSQLLRIIGIHGSATRCSRVRAPCDFSPEGTTRALIVD